MKRSLTDKLCIFWLHYQLLKMSYKFDYFLMLCIKFFKCSYLGCLPIIVAPVSTSRAGSRCRNII
jgi:hypothetical protein